MGIEVSRADEVCKDELFQYRRSGVSHCLCGYNRFYQRFRQNEIAQSQSWKENLGECADINDAAFSLESGQRLKRWSVITIFTVVVILDDERSYARGPIKKLKTSRNRENYAGWKLMRRCDVCEPNNALLHLRDLNPIIVNRRREQLRSSRHECAPRAGVMRLFNQNAVPRIYKNAADQNQSLLRSVDDHNSLRTCINSTQSPKASGDCFP